MTIIRRTYMAPCAVCGGSGKGRPLGPGGTSASQLQAPCGACGGLGYGPVVEEVITPDPSAAFQEQR